MKDPHKSSAKGVRAAIELIQTAALEAIQKHPPMNSPHEGKAVIEEELDELWEVVKREFPDEHRGDLLKEASHVGATAARFIADLCLSEEE